MELVFPRRRSAVLQYGQSDEGGPELRLYHADLEVAFDEPEFFGFAETLVRQSRFLASEAMGWGDGYDWAQVGPLLEALTEAGILERAGAALPDTMRAATRPSPLPPARSDRPRSWRECEAIFSELTGRPLELGWLELAVPVFRLAHIALDTEGRQVGEANVFPPALRLEIPTKWRTCLYEGTRHQPDRPMNVEALRGMQAHWVQMMALLGKVRAAYLDRQPMSGEALTLGEIERLAVCVLALPTYQLMRMQGAVENGGLSPVLSSLFRVTDGLRMVVHQMLFVPIGEPARQPSDRLTAAAIHDYAERNYSFHSEHGVCAGPPQMVAEFLRVLVEGGAPAGPFDGAFDPAVERALADLPAAMDYAFLGLQAHAAAFSVWPAMARGYEAIAQALAITPQDGLATRFATHVQTLKSATYLGEEPMRAHRDAVYDEMFATSANALGEVCQGDHLTRLRSAWRDRLDRQRGVIESALAVQQPARSADALTAAVLEFAAAAGSAIEAGSKVQAKINRLLGRTQPVRGFDSHDLDLHNHLQDTQPRRVPYLLDELRAAFGLALQVSANGLEIRVDDLSHPHPHSAAQPSG